MTIKITSDEVKKIREDMSCSSAEAARIARKNAVISRLSDVEQLLNDTGNTRIEEAVRIQNEIILYLLTKNI